MGTRRHTHTHTHYIISAAAFRPSALSENTLTLQAWVTSLAWDKCSLSLTCEYFPAYGFRATKKKPIPLSSLLLPSSPHTSSAGLVEKWGEASPGPVILDQIFIGSKCFQSIVKTGSCSAKPTITNPGARPSAGWENRGERPQSINSASGRT